MSRAYTSLKSMMQKETSTYVNMSQRSSNNQGMVFLRTCQNRLATLIGHLYTYGHSYVQTVSPETLGKRPPKCQPMDQHHASMAQYAKHRLDTMSSSFSTSACIAFSSSASVSMDAKSSSGKSSSKTS